VTDPERAIKRRRSSVLHDAYHEAAHAVVELELGLPVSSVHVSTTTYRGDTSTG